MTEMYYSRVDYTYQGGSKIFTVPFDYIDISYVKVFINDELITSWNCLTDSQLQIDDTVELNSGDKVSIIRQTPINERMVVFSDTSILNESTQNLAQQQMFDVVQEVNDNLNAHKRDVEDIKPYVKTVADNINDVINVEENMSDINVIAENIESVGIVANDTENIDSVANNILNINAVNSNQSNINIAANNTAAINTVASNISVINTVKNNINNVNQTASNVTNINKVSNDITNINTVAENINVIDDFSAEVDLINQSKALESGKVSTNTTILSDIKSYAHSTFDLSKFAVVGSPTITNNGIASGFSSGNLLRTSSVDFSIPWEITSAFTAVSSTDGQMLWKIYAGGDGWFDYIYINQNTPQLLFTFKTSDDTQHYLRFNYTLINGKDYLYKVGWTGTQYYMKLYDEQNNLIEEKTVNSNLTLVGTTGYVQLGYGSTGHYVFKGSIDLKQFSITVDGIEVFSGNKTGLDTIKPDNYTVVGTPTISADGVASGFSNNDYISSNNYIFNVGDKTWEILLSCKVGTTITGAAQTPLGMEVNKRAVFISFSANLLNAAIYLSSDGSNNDIANNVAILPTLTEDGYKDKNITFRVKFTGTQYLIYYSIDGAEFVLGRTIDSTTPVYSGGHFYIGRNSISNRYITGSVDLNSFKVYVDGNLVYQPCLKIPYTESKTGSKIVNAVYRDRVQSMYDGFGYAPYYTFSDTDFTLPMGEIYGMIERKVNEGDLTSKANTDLSNVPTSKGILTESYVNGTSWYRVYSDGFCMQGGLATTTSSASTITLLKEYADTDYTILATSNFGTTTTTSGIQAIHSYDITTTGFKLWVHADSNSISRNWVTFGYIN